MERLRRKRATSNPDFASVSAGHEMFRNHPKPASNCSSSYSNGIDFDDDDLLTFELGLRSRKSTPMKKLLAREMCHDSDSTKRRSSSPGVVAKLMGLDALPPPPQHNHLGRQRQRQRQETATSFKDVYEVPVSEHDDMAFIRQKFSDAKRLAHHDQSSKEFRDALNVLDSNRHLLLRYLHQPDNPNPRQPRPRHHCCHVTNPSQPTRIVVLKPNLGKIESRDDDDDRKDRDVPLAKKREIEACGIMRKSVSRQLAKEITRQMRLSSASSSVKGYAADDSSCCSDDESPTLSRHTHTQRRRRSSRSNSQSHSSAESSMSREGKKRLSERWKLNHHHNRHSSSESSEIRAMRSGRGSTLAEMLLVSEEKEGKHLGISSRDGWKETAAKLTRSRSLPISSKAGEDRYVSVSLKERKKSRSRSNSATSFPCPYVVSQRQSDDTCPKKIQSLSGNVTETIPVDRTPTPTPRTKMDVEPDTVTMDDQNSPTPLQEPPSEDREDSPVPMDQSIPASESKEGDQPSPVSVLAAPFSDDPSSSPDCFESLSADLQGLRMQLQLLKLESESYEEGDMVLSSDGDDKNEEKSSSMMMMCNSTSQKSWEKRYAIDALVRSTLDDDDPDSFVASWHSCEFPIGPHVFEALEKEKEEEEEDYEHRSKCERKLLFDRINEAIVEMNERSLLGPNELQERLIRFLSGSEEEAKKEMAEKSQSQWLDVREDVEAIAANIQKFLYDELVAEFLDCSAY